MHLFESLFARLFGASLLAISLAHVLAWVWYCSMTEPGLEPEPLLRFLALLGFQVLGLVITAAWAARVLARPISRLGSASERLADDLNGPPMNEHGLLESRKGARALNRLQRRIGQQLAQQERVVWAVSHDLRTPLSRLRLRLELLEDPALREGFRRDLDQANAQVEKALASLREQRFGL
ncbi:histidine kinase dimerization/phospho-acceptor domain-containing protein [Pseudomonas sp. NPDC007930]|uniref:histidine kinase dimerization/phospho-acceptor domain-containing protein n=1 Tax=Pseudomonas sp. NPDC007930 TaxID=3364417 RepID=UPI0036EE7EEB